MKAYNPADDKIINWRWVFKALAILGFIYMGAVAHTQNESLVMLISFLIAAMVPWILGDRDE